MPITDHFTLEELTFSEKALRLGIPNVPPPDAVANLTRLATVLLEPLRDLLGVPIHINSGYRSFAINADVGGSSNSAHLGGCAADCVPIGLNMSIAFDKIQKSGLPFDQLIFECNAWLHIAVVRDVSTAPRGDCLLASGGPGNWSYRDA